MSLEMLNIRLCTFLLRTRSRSVLDACCVFSDTVSALALSNDKTASNQLCFSTPNAVMLWKQDLQMTILAFALKVQ